MQHRPEIDGLRCLAIVPVVAFHAGIWAVPGGFVGVDVFFVVSGYLITSIILREIADGTFSYARFFGRRARRILPALGVVVLATLAAAHVLSLPNNLVDTAQASLAALLGVSNILFWQQTSYFSTGAEFQPLLHTWSLGVEEQFYLILPLVLMAAVWMGLSLRLLFAIGLPCAFAAGLWLSYAGPSAAFYLLPARIWELGIGSALAVGLVPKVTDPALARSIRSAGLGAVGLSFFLITPQTAFPGYAALLPCLGAAAIIHSADVGGGAAYRLLCLPAIRFVGLISYSLYLWHWPVFVFARMGTATPHLSPAAMLAATLLSFGLACLTWKYVERPFREGRVSGMRIGMAAMVAAVAVAVSAGAAIRTQGWPGRLDETALRMAAAGDDIDPLRDPCRGVAAFADERCVFGAEGVEPSFALIGDSHAAAIRPAVERWAIEQGRSGVMGFLGGCAILFGVERTPYRQNARCSAFKTALSGELARYPALRTILIGGRWEALYSANRPEAGPRYRIYLTDAHSAALTRESSQQVLVRSLRETIGRLEDRYGEVVLIGAVPEIGFDVPMMLGLKALNRDWRPDKTTDIGMDNTVRSSLDDVLRGIARDAASTRYVSLWRHFCTPRCKLVWDGLPVYSDDDHVAYSAARGPIGAAFLREMDATADDRGLANP